MTKANHVTELIPAYALDILDEAETKLVRDHLQTCTYCQDELRAYQRVVEDLPLAVAEVEPPAHLKEKILQQARGAKNASPPSANRSWWQELKERLFFRSPAWGLVSLVLILVLGASNLFLWQRLNRLESESRQALATVMLTGTELTPGATGLMIISRDGEHGSLVVDGLPLLDDSQQYQVWLIRNGQRASGGVFSVYDEGYGVLKLDAPEPLDSYQAVGITIEPAGGSPGPTGERVLGGEIHSG